MVDLGQYDAIKHERKNNSDVFDNFKARCKRVNQEDFEREMELLKRKGD